jgi:hypothetical protein
MTTGKKIGLFSIVFIALFLMVSLPQAKSADATVAATTVASAPDENCSKVTVKIGALFLRRGDNKDKGLMSAVASPRYNYLRAQVGGDDLNLGWAPGMDASIMLQNKEFGIEARYVGLTQWSKSHSEINYATWNDGAEAAGKLKSALNSVELNGHWWPCANDRFSLLAGFRWLRVTDRLFGYEYGVGGDFWNYYEGSASSRNSLYGGQIGADGLLIGKRDQGLSLDGVVKVGVFANRIKNAGSYYGDWNEPGYGYGYEYGSGSDSKTKATFLSEVGLNLNYAFTKNIALTVGYELLYINKVATPANYLKTQDVLYQGSRVGLNFNF